MYPESEYSFELVKNILLDTFPVDISLKKHRENDAILALNSEYALVFMNELAAEFLERCTGKKNLSTIISELYSIYDVEEYILADDIVKLVRELQLKRIIRIELQDECNQKKDQS